VVAQLIGPSLTLAAGAGGSQSSAPAGRADTENSVKTSIACARRRTDPECGRSIVWPYPDRGVSDLKVHDVVRSDVPADDAEGRVIRY
jgi:hypothetical protein